MNDVFMGLLLLSIVGFVVSLKLFGKKPRIIFGVLIVLFFVLFGVTSDASKPKNNKEPIQEAPKTSVTSKPTETPTPSQHELDATIKFSDTAFLITNNEKADWTECKLELNSGILRGGYTYRAALMLKQDALIVPFREFTKGDGTRFNSYETKAQNLSISCTVNGQRGFGYFTIN